MGKSERGYDAEQKAREAATKAVWRARAREEAVGFVVNSVAFGAAATLCVAGRTWGHTNAAEMAAGAALGCAFNIMKHVRELRFIGKEKFEGSVLADLVFTAGQLGVAMVGVGFQAYEVFLRHQYSYFWSGLIFALGADMGLSGATHSLFGIAKLEED